MGTGSPVPLDNLEDRKAIKRVFPGLGSDDFTITRERDEDYNCIAWALNDTRQYWWPGPRGSGCYWPPGVPRDDKLETFIQVYEGQLFLKCESAEPEPGFDKVAIYEIGGKGKHAARLWIEDPMWTSKLGARQDIEHHSLAGLEGTLYGTV